MLSPTAWRNRSGGSRKRPDLFRVDCIVVEELQPPRARATGRRLAAILPLCQRLPVELASLTSAVIPSRQE